MTNKSSRIIIYILAGIIAVTAGLLVYLTNKPEPPLPDANVSEKEAVPSEEPVFIESADYELQKEDLSFSNEERGLYLSQFFEKVVLTEEGDNYDRINEYINSLAESFVAESSENEAFVKDEKYLSNMHFTNEHTAKVTKNDEGILSIKMSRMWFMGGTSSMDVYGINFDLNTGKKLNLPEYLSMSQSKAERYLKEEALKQIKEGYFEDASKIIENYVFDNFTYYLQEDSIFLCFTTYELAPGAAGPIIMEIPIPNKNQTIK